MPTFSKANALRALRRPLTASRALRALLRGALVRARFRWSDRVRIGKSLFLVRRLVIRGPGSVVIGKRVQIDGSSHDVTLFTYSPDAELSIGDGSFLNGTRFGCHRRVRIGQRCILADCRIMDSGTHSVYPERRDDPRYV